MASLTKRADSSYWWICYIDHDGIRKRKSTDFKHADPVETKKARALEASWTAAEANRTAVIGHQKNLWAEWVPSFLKRHARGRTLERYEAAWNWIYAYLREIGVTRPSELAGGDGGDCG